MVQMPTGSGKNKVIGALTRELKNLQILVITPRILLVKETRKDVDCHGVLSGSLGKDLGDQHKLIIGTYQTMIGQVDIQKPDVIFIDECHLVPEDGDYRDLTLPLDCVSHSRAHALACLASHSLSNCIGLT